jgi:hypothetical protein
MTPLTSRMIDDASATWLNRASTIGSPDRFARP